MYLVIFLIALNLFKLFIARYFPLIGDEAYYWLWGQHLDLSYVDHPPMIAYVNFALTSLFGNNEIVIRLGAISIVLLISWIIYLTGKELYDKGAGTLAAIIFNLLPTFFGGGIFLVPQTLLFLFWSLSFYLIVKIIKTRNIYYWYLLGITIGLGLLSDYVMLLFPIAIVVFLLFNRDNQHWFTKKEPYLGMILAFLFFSPVIFWNVTHHFPFIPYHGERVTIARLENFLYFVILQMILYTPPIFLSTLKTNLDLFRDRKFDLSSVLSGIVFIPFALLSPFVMIGGHWSATAYLPSLLSSNKFKKITIFLTIFSAVLTSAFGLIYYLFLYPIPKELIGQEYKINQELNYYLKEIQFKKGRKIILANNLGLAGLVSFYGKTKVYLPSGRHPQYDLWGKPQLQKGDNVIYFALNEFEVYEKLKPLFKKIWIEPKKRLFTKDADIAHKTQIFHGENFQQGVIP